jgi:hypothetical protein
VTVSKTNVAREVRFAKSLYGHLPRAAVEVLKELLTITKLSIAKRDVIRIGEAWYVTHSGLLRLAYRRRCIGIRTEQIIECSNPAISRWVFKATVYRSRNCKGFVGYGDAEPTNVAPVLRGSELRIAETRAVNRALRKAYGIGICSVDEIGSFERQQAPERPIRKLPPESTNRNSRNGHYGNGNGTRVRDRLCQIIRQHNLDAELVKAYAVDFCGTKTLREASREQVENFVAHLANWAVKDRNALLCQLNSYQSRQEPAAAPQQQAGAA